MDISRDRLEMLMQLMALEFTGVELNLYLDTHPYDQDALALHNENVEALNCVKDAYEMKFGPITHEVESPCPWQWIQNPWPWEIDYKRGI